MTYIAFSLIVFSAVLHASWNLLAKKNHITVPYYAMLCGTNVILLGHVQFWTPVHLLEMPWPFWAALAGSVFSDAILYCTGIVFAYRYIEMSVAYPMMRSLPIVFTVFLTAVFHLGQPLTASAVAGMMIVVAGCLMMPLPSFRSFDYRKYLKPSMLFVVLTALGTTGYTICDSLAQHAMRDAADPAISAPVISLTFYNTRGIALTTTLLVIALLIPSQRAVARQFIREKNWKPFLAGICAMLTYISVLIAMNYVSNVSYVQVFRQLGLPFGMFAGMFFLNEKVNAPKIVGVILILSGLLITVL